MNETPFSTTLISARWPTNFNMNSIDYLNKILYVGWLVRSPTFIFADVFDYDLNQPRY